MGSVGPSQNEKSISLDYLVTIWPVAESLAIHLPLGDLVTLARTSRSLRAGLHGCRIDEGKQLYDEKQIRSDLIPHLGQHQTSYWKHLKQISPFTCVNKIHTKGQKLKPCVYCSKPICDACIVRDSFKKGKEDTFKNRLRYFCRECWTEGKPTKAHRYPTVTVNYRYGRYDSFKSPKEHPVSTDSDSFCACTLKDNGWLCIDCKDWQNNYDAPSIRRSATPTYVTQCYALGCENPIDQSFATRDRQRICLWCQKPLRRQYGGEDRHAWNQKTITARAINAEFRSRDIEEYNRQRWRGLRMSRNEMRGGNGDPQDDRLEFVRHLDTVNYLGTPWRLNQKESPSPDAVYKSKNGIWQYQKDFLLAFGRIFQSARSEVAGLDVEGIRRSTREGALPFARTNKMLQEGLVITKPRRIRSESVPIELEVLYNTLRTRIISLVSEITQEDGLKGYEDDICKIIFDQYDLKLTKSNFRKLWEISEIQRQTTATEAVEMDRPKKRTRLSDIDLNSVIYPDSDLEVDERTLVDAAIDSDSSVTPDENIRDTVRPTITNTSRTEADSPSPPPTSATTIAATVTAPFLPNFTETPPITHQPGTPSSSPPHEIGNRNANDTDTEAMNNTTTPLSQMDEPPSYIP